jgi:hypothetical protein
MSHSKRTSIVYCYDATVTVHIAAAILCIQSTTHLRVHYQQRGGAATTDCSKPAQLHSLQVFQLV